MPSGVPYFTSLAISPNSVSHLCQCFITTNHFRLVKRTERARNTPKIKVQASILRGLQAPGIHRVLKRPALTFKHSALSIKTPLARTITSGQEGANRKTMAFINRKIIAFSDWLRFLYTLFFLLYMPLFVVTVTSRLGPSTSLAALRPAARWAMIAGRAALCLQPWHRINSNECLSRLVFHRLGIYY